MVRPVAQEHALWLNGVIIGLAIKEATVRATVVIFDRMGSDDSYLVICRLVTFLALCIRSYLTIGEFFHRVYQSPSSAATFPKTNYGADFLNGCGHFVLMSLWAISIDRSPPWLFFVLLEAILLTSLLWWLFSRGLSTLGYVGTWAVINCVTAVVPIATGLLAFAAMKIFASQPESSATYHYVEMLALAPVCVACVVEVAGVTRGESHLERELQALLTRLGTWLLRVAGAISARRSG